MGGAAAHCPTRQSYDRRQRRESTKKGQLIAYGLTDVERGRAACGSGSLDVEDRREGDDDGGDGEQRW